MVFGEQPSAAKWNQLGTNDAGFKDGTNIDTNAITAPKLATDAITLGYASITADITTTAISATQATGLSVTVTIPSGSRRIKVTVYASDVRNNNSGGGTNVSLWDGTVGSGTQIQRQKTTNGAAASQYLPLNMVWTGTPSAGSKTYNVGWFREPNVGTCVLSADATYPAYILVEAI